MEPTPISTLSPPWIVVIILITISGAEAPKAKNEAPATSSLRFNFTQRISKLGTRNSSQSYPLLENTKSTLPIIANEIKKMKTSITIPHQYLSIASRQRPSKPDSHHYTK